MTKTAMTPQVRIWTEEEVLGIVLNHPNLLPKFRATAQPADFSDFHLRAICEVILTEPPKGCVPTKDQLGRALGRGTNAILSRIHAYTLPTNFDVLLDRLVAGRDE